MQTRGFVRSLRSPLVGLATLLFAPILVGACTSPSDSTIGSSSDEIRPLQDEEVVGQIAYTETVRGIAGPPAGAYRALRFEGTIGDEIDAWVRSQNGDARAWLLDASFKTLVENDDGNALDDGPPIPDARLRYTLRKTGTYYIAFREKYGQPASFDVSLARVASSNGDPRFPAWLEGHLEYGTPPAALARTDVYRTLRAKQPRSFRCDAGSVSLYRDMSVKLVDQNGLAARIELTPVEGRDELLEYLACHTFGEPDKAAALAACPEQKQSFTIVVPLVERPQEAALEGETSGPMKVKVTIEKDPDLSDHRRAAIHFSVLEQSSGFDECLGPARFASTWFVSLPER
jgi:hypothetical protein